MASGKDKYEVGYGKPPVEHQWAKGTSGNPGGKRRKSEGNIAKFSFNPFLEKFLTEMSRPMNFKEGGESMQLEAFEGVVRSVIVSAVKGNFRAQRLLLESYKLAQEERRNDMAEMLQMTKDYKAEWKLRAAEAERAGMPVPLPRPEHVDLSIERGVIETTGPTDEHQDELWQSVKMKVRRSEMRLIEAKQDNARDPTNPLIQSWLAKCELAFSRVKRLVPPGWDWSECVTEEDALELALLREMRSDQNH